MELITIFLLLIASHFVCDYVLQTDPIARGKNRNTESCLFGVNWWYWMTSHSVTHGLGVGVITGSITLGLLETVAHWLIDFGKCEKWYGLHVDQLLHGVCKVLWVIILFSV